MHGHDGRKPLLSQMSHRWTPLEYFMLRAELDQREIILSEFMPSHLCLKKALHAREVVTLLAETFSAIIQQASWKIPVMRLNHTTGGMSIAKPQHDDSDCILAHVCTFTQTGVLKDSHSLARGFPPECSGQIAFSAGSIIFLIKLTNNILCLG